MLNLSYWQQFESTGKIDDYLTYRCGFSQAEQSGGTGRGGIVGVNPYAGIDTCDRNDIEADAYRGI